MPKSYEKLLSEIKKLQVQADDLKKKERAKAAAQAKAIIKKHALTTTELGLTAQPRPKANGKAATGTKKFKVPPRFKGPKGEMWSGRGITPVWLREAMAQGKKRDDFLIKR
ncbi:MAG TPA: H-NS histone family protein [Steroidobacteraceae bacterium]|nr:H-NS histone family protein [Steroidobacteraceae bacterium]